MTADVMAAVDTSAPVKAKAAAVQEPEPMDTSGSTQLADTPEKAAEPMDTAESPVMAAEKRDPAPEPIPESESRSAARARAQTAPNKTRGFMRAVGGLFKRRSSASMTDNTEPSVTEAGGREPSVTEASATERLSMQRVSRWSRWSHRRSEASASAADVSRGSLSFAQSIAENPPAQEPPQKKTKKVKKEKKPKKDKKKPAPPAVKESPTDPAGLLAAESSDDEMTDVPPEHVNFLFYPGTERLSDFKPELRSSDLDDVHDSNIRPSLEPRMPLFFAAPQNVENLRRSSILSDPREYEF